MLEDNCAKCKELGDKCSCGCHNDERLRKFRHFYHSPIQLAEDDESFKLNQIKILKQRFPTLDDNAIQEMYKQNCHA